MFALLHRGNRNRRVQVVRCAHDDRIHIFLFLEQLAKIRVRRAAVIIPRPPLRSVISIHNFLAGLASRHAARHPQCMRQLNRQVRTQPIPPAVHSQQGLHRFAKLMRIPLRIIHAALIHIAHRHALHVLLLQKVQHHAQSLGPHANKRDVHLVARRHKPSPAQNMPRHNRKSRSRCCRPPQKLAPRNTALRRDIQSFQLFHFAPRRRNSTFTLAKRRCFPTCFPNLGRRPAHTFGVGK